MRKACVNCRHCCSVNTSSYSWCGLRGVAIHSELLLMAFCHHWTKSEPVLPKIKMPINKYKNSLQLDFERALN